MNMERTELARQIYQVSNLRGEFLLRSGVISNQYFDKYLFESQPVLLREIAEHAVERIPEGIDALAGLEMGGIPLAVMMSQLTGIPSLFIRKKAKEYGTCKLAEGGEIEGKRILLVEDVVTSGGAVLEAAAALRRQGALLQGVVCVIDREAGGRINLDAIELPLSALFTMTELKAAHDRAGQA